MVIIIITFKCSTYAQQGVGINATGTAPDNSAGLDVDFTDKGILIPRMTTAERNAIASPANSLMIFNTDMNCLQIYISSQWQSIFCDGGCPAPSVPNAITATGVGQTSFTANWNTSSGATTYFLDVATDSIFTAFVPGFNGLDIGNDTTYVVNGLTCNTKYYYRVHAGNSCDTVTGSNFVSQFTSSCSCTPVVDQQQLVYEAGLSARNLPGYSTWQSFQAGITGTLTQIDQGYFNAMTGTATLKIYTGTGTGGTLLYSNGVTISGTGNFWVTFTISPGVAVTSGQSYTYEIVPIQGGGLPDPYGVQRGGPTDRYVNGTCEFGPGWDDVFKIWVCP